MFNQQCKILVLWTVVKPFSSVSTFSRHPNDDQITWRMYLDLDNSLADHFTVWQKEPLPPSPQDIQHSPCSLLSTTPYTGTRKNINLTISLWQNETISHKKYIGEWYRNKSVTFFLLVLQYVGKGEDDMGTGQMEFSSLEGQRGGRTAQRVGLFGEPSEC